MPKRKSENNLEIIVQKLRKLEKEVKRSRRRRGVPLSSSESRSSSSSPCSSRATSPHPDNQECQEPVPSPEVQVDTENLDAPSVHVEESAQIPTEETTASVDLLAILGEDPSISIEYGPDINADLATRLAHIATFGLNKDTRTDLLKKYLILAKCVNISAPLLNAEIKAAIPETANKRDKCIESRQKIIAAGISSLSRVISKQLELKDKNNDLIKDLMDVARLLCDIQHSESETRRNFALFSVKKELKDQLAQTKIDKCLFGSDFAETIKTAKAVTKSSTDLKRDIPKKSQTTASSAKKDLNWKARTGARRQQPVIQTRHQSATPNATPRGTSSRSFTQRRRHHKQSRRD